MDKSLKHCPNCGEVETHWKFSRERCVVCEEPLDENPVRIGFMFKRDNNQAVVDSMLKDGTLQYSDLKDI